MKSNSNTVLVLIILLIKGISQSCKQEVYQGNYDPHIIKEHSNDTTIPLDSIKAIQLITNQKLQEVYDLGLLYVHNNKDSELDSILFNQMDSYFATKDTIQITNLLNEIRNSKSHYIKISQNEKFLKDSTENDSIFYSKFLIKFYSKDKQYIHSKNKFVEYVLKKNPTKFRGEFKFYFIQFFETDSLIKKKYNIIL